MRRAFKTAFEGGFADVPIPATQEVPGIIQSSFQEPFPWSGAEELFEITFKCGQASGT
jgi:hypothetical protein